MKKRLDVIIFEKGLSDSRNKAQGLIMSGKVFVDGNPADKPGMLYDEGCSVEIKKDSQEFVSRGGYKLEKAINVFGISLNEMISLDAGASTGGFTDCMLRHGCKKVYAVDVGYGQLAWNLRNDERVINYERTNIRYLSKDKIFDDIDFFCADLSFISLCKVLPVIRNLINENAIGVCLIKPQFETEKENVGKNGVVRDSSVRCDVLKKIINFCQENGFSVKGLDYSPIKGPKGNIEYLIYVQKSTHPKISDKIDIFKVEKDSVEKLSKSKE